MELPCTRNFVLLPYIPAIATKQLSLAPASSCRWIPVTLSSEAFCDGLCCPCCWARMLIKHSFKCRLEAFQRTDWGETSTHVDAPSILTGRTDSFMGLVNAQEAFWDLGTRCLEAQPGVGAILHCFSLLHNAVINCSLIFPGSHFSNPVLCSLFLFLVNLILRLPGFKMITEKYNE